MKSLPALSINDLHITIGQRMVLQGISIDIQPGEIVGVIGPNGCGKTTLLNAISGFLPTHKGSILLHGGDITSKEPFERARLGLVRGFQHAGVFREMTVEENINMVVERAEKYPWWWMMCGTWRKKMDGVVTKALKEIDLLSHRHSQAGVLSGGQLRLLELARLKLSKGNVFLIDEPTAGVAPVLKQKLLQEIRDLSTVSGHSVIIVEHDLKFIFDLAERVIVLVDGEKYLEGKPEEVRNDERLRKIYFGD